jgi:hypothetical protein
MGRVEYVVPSPWQSALTTPTVSRKTGSDTYQELWRVNELPKGAPLRL